MIYEVKIPNVDTIKCIDMTAELKKNKVDFRREIIGKSFGYGHTKPLIIMKKGKMLYETVVFYFKNKNDAIEMKLKYL